MTFAVLTEACHFESRELPVPEPADHELLIAVRHVGICGSEITAYRGIHPYRVPPVILGHEMAGSVLATGREVTRFRIGERVVVKPHTFCGRCASCLAGEQNLCVGKRVLGSREWPGAFGPWIVSPDHLTHALPETIADDEAALLDPLCIGLHAVRKAGIQAGDRVAILGAGSIGLSTMMVARATGADASLTDVRQSNLEIAQSLGAAGTYNVARTEESQRLEATASDLPFDAVFIAAGSEGEVARALRIVRRGGRVIVIAHFHRPQIAVDMYTLLTQEKRIEGSITYTGADLERGIHLLAERKVDLRPLISERRGLAEIQDCFARLAAGKEGLVKILLTP